MDCIMSNVFEKGKHKDMKSDTLPIALQLPSPKLAQPVLIGMDIKDIITPSPLTVGAK